MIHYNFIHRSNLTPRRLYQMKLRTNPFLNFVQTIPLVHFFIWFGSAWRLMGKCPKCSVWNSGENCSSLTFSALLDDTSSLKLTVKYRCLLLAWFTEAKTVVAGCWKPPHVLPIREWLASNRDIAQLELSTAWWYSGKTQNINFWSDKLGKIDTSFEKNAWLNAFFFCLLVFLFFLSCFLHFLAVYPVL